MKELKKGEHDESWEIFDHTVPVGSITGTLNKDEMIFHALTERQLLDVLNN